MGKSSADSAKTKNSVAPTPLFRLASLGIMSHKLFKATGKNNVKNSRKRTTFV